MIDMAALCQEEQQPVEEGGTEEDYLRNSPKGLRWDPDPGWD